MDSAAPRPALHDDEVVAMNEALVLASLRQHELIEATESLNAQLKAEIAERRSAEAALRASETRLRNLNADLERQILEGSRELGRANLIDAIESLEHSLVLYDSDDRLVLFNRHLYDQYPLADRTYVVGRPFEAIIRDLVESGAWAVPQGQAAEQFIADRIALHKRADGTVMEAVLPDGRILHISEHRSQSGGYVAVGRDVTRQLKLAEQLREAQKMEAIGRLSGGLAHDLNNYLAVIIGNLDQLADLPQPNAAAPKLIENAIGGALRGAELTRSLLAFSRRQPLDPRVVDVGARIADVTRMLKRTIGENIVVDLQVAEGLWPVRVDGPQLDICMVNLANNARDAMPKGGRLSIALSNVRATAENPEEPDVCPCDHVQIAFSDTGAGMSAETLARAFEPFFSTKGPGHGSGLGLSMAHGFVHQSEGTIQLASTPGRGTTVSICLPRALGAGAGEGVDRPARRKATVLPRGHERILLVEDNEDVRAATAHQLKSLGYTVAEVDSADAALARLEENAAAFDMVFSDVMMPGRIDGLELARLVRERWPRIAMLIASGFSAGDADELAEKQKGLTVLRKPYRKAALAVVLRDTLADRDPGTMKSGTMTSSTTKSSAPE